MEKKGIQTSDRIMAWCGGVKCPNDMEFCVIHSAESLWCDSSIVLTDSAKDCRYAAYLIFVSTNVQTVLELNKGNLPNDTAKLTKLTEHFTPPNHAIILSEVCRILDKAFFVYKFWQWCLRTTLSFFIRLKLKLSPTIEKMMKKMHRPWEGKFLDVKT